MKRLLSALTLLALPGFAVAFDITVTGGKSDESNVVVRVRSVDVRSSSENCSELLSC